MIIEDIGGHKIERYNSVEEILIPRYMNFNRLVMIESGIGSTPAAIDSHDKQIIAYAKEGDTDKIIQQVKNKNKALHLIMEGFNPGLMCYVPLIKSIDGNPLYDYSDENAKRLVDKFGTWGATPNKLYAIIDAVKKKFERELDELFPGRFDSPQVKDYFGKRKKRILLILKKLIDEKAKVESEIERIDKYLYDLLKPEEYSGRGGIEAKYILSYEEMSFVLSQHTSQHPKEMTVVEYLRAWEVVKKQMKPKPKTGRK